MIGITKPYCFNDGIMVHLTRFGILIITILVNKNGEHAKYNETNNKHEAVE